MSIVQTAEWTSGFENASRPLSPPHPALSSRLLSLSSLDGTTYLKLAVEIARGQLPTSARVMLYAIPLLSAFSRLRNMFPRCDTFTLLCESDRIHFHISISYSHCRLLSQIPIRFTHGFDFIIYLATLGAVAIHLFTLACHDTEPQAAFRTRPTRASFPLWRTWPLR